jgi:archaetidylinositol phosphate synthase
MAPAQRELTFLLADPERRLLRAIAARLPRWVTSDHLTVLGICGALGVAAAYALSRLSPAWLWAASGCLALQWFGDSLDGTVARVRGVERPRYGYYLDHVVDAGSTAVIGLGLGLSSYVNPCVALGMVIVYLALSINVYLEANVFGVFRLAYSRLGPTEVRILLIALNVGLAVSGPGRGVYLAASATLALLGTCMLGMLFARIATNLRTLSHQEPARQAGPRSSRLTATQRLGTSAST